MKLLNQLSVGALSQQFPLRLIEQGMPVVASATPAYTRAMQGAGLDLTCRDKEQWLSTLECLLADETARRDAGCRGKTYADREFGEGRLLARWDAVFTSLGFHFGAQAPMLP